MSKFKFLMTLFLILCLMVLLVGCPSNGPGDDPGDDPGNDPGDNPEDPGNNPQEPQNDNNESGTNISITAAVTVVPKKAVDSVDRAFVRQGDLWFGTSDGLMWRQTKSGNVGDVLWAPDGHAVAYFADTTIYYLVPGESPVKIDEKVQAAKAWKNNDGFVWSPDSTKLAYGLKNGEQLRITSINGMAKGTFLLDERMEQGPYWLSEDNLVFGTGVSDNPSVYFLNSSGDVLNKYTEHVSPYPVPNGVVMVNGEYNPTWEFDLFANKGLSIANPDGSGLTEIYDKSTYKRLMVREPIHNYSLVVPRYFAISDGENLFLYQYGGLYVLGKSRTTDLLTQDLFLTFSEFHYPLWFSWAPSADYLAALRFKFTQEGDYGHQEGYWDLLTINRNGTKEVLLDELYFVSGTERPVPFQGIQPINWSPCSEYVNYLVDRGNDEYDLWSVNVSTKKAELVLAHCNLPIYRP